MEHNPLLQNKNIKDNMNENDNTNSKYNYDYNTTGSILNYSQNLKKFNNSIGNTNKLSNLSNKTPTSLIKSNNISSFNVMNKKSLNSNNPITSSTILNSSSLLKNREPSLSYSTNENMINPLSFMLQTPSQHKDSLNPNINNSSMSNNNFSLMKSLKTDFPHTPIITSPFKRRNY